MKKLRRFLLDEIELAYQEAENADSPELLKTTEQLEDVIYIALSLPKPYRKHMVKHLAVMFDESPDYREEWRP